MLINLFQEVTQGVERSHVRGVGFDATCSLVVLDQSFRPVAVNEDGKGNISVAVGICSATVTSVLPCKGLDEEKERSALRASRKL